MALSYMEEVDRQLSPIGTSLQLSCRSTYPMSNTNAPYQRNEFHFTRPGLASAFFARLRRSQKALINTVALDLRNCIDRKGRSVNGAALAEWEYYINGGITENGFFSDCQKTPGLISFKRPHLRSDMPKLRVLVLDLTAAQVKASYDCCPLGFLLVHLQSQCFSRTWEVKLRGYDDNDEVVEVGVPKLFGNDDNGAQGVMWLVGAFNPATGRLLTA